jgi:hypothetical protein
MPDAAIWKALPKPKVVEIAPVPDRPISDHARDKVGDTVTDIEIASIREAPTPGVFSSPWRAFDMDKDGLPNLTVRPKKFKGVPGGYQVDRNPTKAEKGDTSFVMGLKSKNWTPPRGVTPEANYPVITHIRRNRRERAHQCAREFNELFQAFDLMRDYIGGRTPERDWKLLELRASGMRVKEIARQLGFKSEAAAEKRIRVRRQSF